MHSMHQNNHRQQPYLLFRRHPILISIFLLASAGSFVVVSFHADALFPILSLLNMPTTLICRLAAIVLGICGTLTSIISVLERIDDRNGIRLFMRTQAKEQQV
ncbi:MAG TPA: hypothetical protein VL461_02365 [Dictyobacter sp.]|nr:hypothetical protein [Dictyobacter sp.]